MPKSFTTSLVASLFFISCTGNPSGSADETDTDMHSADTLAELKIKSENGEWKRLYNNIDNIYLQMKYADTANFLHEQLYPCPTCILREPVANALIKAAALAKDSGYGLLLYDCYRPLSIQYKMFEKVSDPKYVADPKIGSKHNRGMAVDLSLIKLDGSDVDMGCGFDDFTEIASFAYPDLSPEQKNNRKLLRDIMVNAGFAPFESEWWHFNYKAMDFDISDKALPCE